MAKSVTLADIAEKVGVSNVAVSKALSGKPGVSEELRKKIKEIAAEVGYVPSAAGRNSASETGNIGVIISEFYYEGSVSFYGKLYEMVVRALYDNQYYGIMELLSHEDEKARAIPKVVQDEKVDGLIFLGPMEEEYTTKMAEQAGMPVFFLDAYVPLVELDAVISDGYYGTYQLTNYLIKQGHRKIGYVGSVDENSSIADRYWGYRRSLRENQIEFQKDWEIPDRYKKGKILDKILDTPGDMEAYVCNCDHTAHFVIRDLEKAGYGVPEDVSVVGFDNYLPFGMEQNRITSYEVDKERMARICVKSLIRKIKRQEYTGGIQIVTGKIVEKQTVKRRR